MSPTINNIDIFYATSALIFSELYKNIPIPTTLNYQHLSETLFSEKDTVSSQKVAEVFINTVTWLRKSEFIWLDTEGELDVYGVLLSPKGLEVLSIIPQSSNAGETIGERLVALTSDGLSDDKTELVKLAIAAGR